MDRGKQLHFSQRKAFSTYGLRVTLCTTIVLQPPLHLFQGNRLLIVALNDDRQIV